MSLLSWQSNNLLLRRRAWKSFNVCSLIRSLGEGTTGIWSNIWVWTITRILSFAILGLYGAPCCKLIKSLISFVPLRRRLILPRFWTLTFINHCWVCFWNTRSRLFLSLFLILLVHETAPDSIIACFADGIASILAIEMTWFHGRERWLKRLLFWWCNMTGSLCRFHHPWLEIRRLV